MNLNHLDILRCPVCSSHLVGSDLEIHHSRFIVKGKLTCDNCRSTFPISNHIPRFCTSVSHPADSFGYQWNSFALSQIDNCANTDESYIRLTSETCLSSKTVEDKTVLEVGCGAGRFLHINLSFNPSLLVGLDVTSAVDSVFQHISPYTDNLLLVQADILSAPFKHNSFDFVYSIGVLHHTPDPYLHFKYAASYVADKGFISVSLYENSLAHRISRNSVSLAFYDLLWSLNLLRCELYRSLFKRFPAWLQVLYCKIIIPPLHYINKVPFIRFIRYLFPSTCYSNLPLSFSIVDTMDTYATEIVHQYRAKTLFHWFTSIGCDAPYLHNSRDGWVSVSGSLRSQPIDSILSSSQPQLPASRF